MTDGQGPDLIRRARVKLAHYPATPAELRFTFRSRWSRLLRSFFIAVFIPPVALVAFLIPPHGEPLFAAVVGGLYLIYREASTSYVVSRFRGSCPRCGAALDLKRGSRLTSAREIPCFGCHFHPRIELEPT